MSFFRMLISILAPGLCPFRCCCPSFCRCPSCCRCPVAAARKPVAVPPTVPAVPRARARSTFLWWCPVPPRRSIWEVKSAQPGGDQFEEKVLGSSLAVSWCLSWRFASLPLPRQTGPSLRDLVLPRSGANFSTRLCRQLRLLGLISLCFLRPCFGPRFEVVASYQRRRNKVSWFALAWRRGLRRKKFFGRLRQIPQAIC